MITKVQLIKVINELPDNFSIEELLNRIILMNKIEDGLIQSKFDRTFTTKEAMNKLKKWL